MPKLTFYFDKKRMFYWLISPILIYYVGTENGQIDN